MADLNDTLAFIKVVEGGSFTAAARELKLPKTTLSRRVRELERRLGAQLLHRTTRRLSLTEAGTIYFRQCRQIPQALADAESAVEQIQGQPRGKLRVTSSYSVMMSLIAPLLGDFRALYPDVHIDLMLTYQTPDLVKEQIDVSLLTAPTPLADSSMLARRLGLFPNRVYAGSAYLARRGEPVHPIELPRHSTLATRYWQRGSGYAWPLRNGGAIENFEISPVIEADDPEVLKIAMLGGAGLMMGTDIIMQQLVAEGTARPVMPGWCGPGVELHAVFPGGHLQPPKLRAFIDFLVSRLRAQGEIATADGATVCSLESED
ncbi:LysR family transcriptional regulator [Bradyrhizobium guangzhouense]|uniref:LysR family transcriptional regulator n=1 Tax=Bradyrhizobium guangzhouense TaxID=1325095 RepID=A0ABY0E9S4_9BRAD|nr:LysR family transcriptional regulator [Bradyrhizobium guangzhouense]RXH15808.1 LysR family transcriptional regulator [Bradyrhizobium guangzhouense]